MFRVVLPCIVFYFYVFISGNQIESAQVELHKDKKLKRNYQQDGLAYANFVPHNFHYLNVSRLGTLSVSDLIDCGIWCVQNPSCYSFNLATSPDLDGKLRCELLYTDRYNSSAKLEQSAHFHHYSLYVSSFHVLILSRFSRSRDFTNSWGRFFKRSLFQTRSNVYSWVNQRLDRRWPTEG